MGIQNNPTTTTNQMHDANVKTLRKRNRLVSFPECMGLINPHVMHRFQTKLT